MDSTIAKTAPGTSFVTSAPRATPAPPRVRFGEVLAGGAGALVKGAEAAVASLPGAPMMAFAVRSGSGAITSLGGGAWRAPLPNPLTGTLSSASAGGAATPVPASASGSAEGPGAPGGAGNGPGGGDGLQSSLAQAQEMNLYYLQVQEQVNAQNRTFSTLSNVMKAEHDTVKNAIGNIR